MAADVVIIGAGIIGGSIAWRLAQAGLRVDLLDAGEMGGEASWAGAGMLAPGGEVLCRSLVGDLILKSHSMYPAFVQELGETTGTPIDYLRCGGLELPEDDHDWQAMLARTREQERMGIRFQPVDPAALDLPLAPAPGALFYPDDAIVDPRDIMRALRAACLQNGVTIREGCRVESIELSGGSAKVHARDGGAAARWVVVAAGAWSSRIALRGAGASLPRTFPVRGHLVGYSLESGSIGSIVRSGHTYILQRSSGFTIAGTSAEQVGFDRHLDPEVVAAICARASRLLPGLFPAAPLTAWTGFRPGADNEEPVTRRLEDTPVWLAYGHYRNGILLAPLTARIVADGITSSSGRD
jgi:glycine oxidase